MFAIEKDEYLSKDLSKKFKEKLTIINKDILKVNEPIINGFDIGTLGTNLSSKEESNINITKGIIFSQE